MQPDTRPGIKFDSNGVCPACRYFESLNQVDWHERRKELDEIVHWGKNHNKSGYDCIIGVSGGKDSTRQALFVKDVLKMNPLLVSLGYPPDQITQMGVDNASNLIKHGFDCITINPAPQLWKKLMYKSFFLGTNWAKSTELALFSSVPKLAIAYQIPLLWWGENAALQLGDLNVMGKNGSDGNNLRKQNTLNGADYKWLLSEKVKKNNVLQYIYPSEREMEDANLKIIFLGYFWKDWSSIDNGNFAALRGLEIRKEHPRDIQDLNGTSSLDEEWVSMNQMIKYLKFGFGRITDYVNEEIRNSRLTRDEAIEFVEKFDGKCAEKYIDSFCEFIEISKIDFWKHVDKSVNRNLFDRDSLGKWVAKFKVGVDI